MTTPTGSRPWSDWRYTAGLCGSLALICVLIALVTSFSGRIDSAAALRETSEQTACRADITAQEVSLRGDELDAMVLVLTQMTSALLNLTDPAAIAAARLEIIAANEGAIAARATALAYRPTRLNVVDICAARGGNVNPDRPTNPTTGD